MQEWGLDVRPPHKPACAEDHALGGGVAQATRKLLCLHTDSKWEDSWTLGLT